LNFKSSAQACRRVTPRTGARQLAIADDLPTALEQFSAIPASKNIGLA
jgi:hypothetical protein